MCEPDPYPGDTESYLGMFLILSFVVRHMFHRCQSEMKNTFEAYYTNFEQHLSFYLLPTIHSEYMPLI